jgi:hypothetical protein
MKINPAQWHLEVCRIADLMQMNIKTGVIGTATMRDYATRLEQIGKEMRNAADELKMVAQDEMKALWENEIRQ